MYKKYNFLPSDIYNLNETGCMTVYGIRNVRVTAPRVGKVTSAERGMLVTTLVAINACGNSVSAMFVFPRVS